MERVSYNKRENKIWALFLHLSFNMWEGYVSPDVPRTKDRGYRPYLRLSYNLWKDTLRRMSENGMNMVVITLGNSIKYETHPEMAVEGAWSVDQLHDELEKIRQMGIEPIPSLNFSAAHDAWLTTYSRMLSTNKYYEVCRDLIKEVSDIFDRPRFFHLGMDEESAHNQKNKDLLIVRQNEIFWGDFYYLIGEVQKQGVRPWVWNGPSYWKHPEQFYKNMPKSVLQSNWDNHAIANLKKSNARFYINLEDAGYDQLPMGSTYYGGKDLASMMDNVKFCSEHIDDSRLFGFMQTTWRPTVEKYREEILKSVQLIGEAKRWYDKNKE